MTFMRHFLEKLDYLIKKDWEDKKKFAEKCGIPYRTIINWKNSGYKNMSATTFVELCNFLGVTMESMAYDDKEIEYISDTNKNDIHTDEHKLLQGYRQLNQEGKIRLLERLESLIEDGYVEGKIESTKNKSDSRVG